MSKKEEFIEYVKYWRRDHPTTIPKDLEILRQRFNSDFPKEKISELSLEDYALGNQEKNPNSFCQQVEFDTKKIGSISGGSAFKHGVFWSTSKQQYEYTKSLGNTPESAFYKIKEILTSLIEKVDLGEFNDLDKIVDQVAPHNNTFRVKPLALYFPDFFLPIAQPKHLEDFLQSLGFSSPSGTIAKNIVLLGALRSFPELEDFDTWGMMCVLYDFREREEQKRSWIFKCDPKIYDLISALVSLDSMTWLVSKYKDEVNCGDKVYFWVSGTQAGIVGVGVITSGLKEREILTDEKQFIQNSYKLKGKKPRVLIDVISYLEKPLTAINLQQISDLSDLSILRYHQGTNFPVSLAEAKVIDQLIVDQEHKIHLSSKFTRDQLLAATDQTVESLDRIIRTLHRKKQIILTGTPGTGKTHLAQNLAKHLTSETDGLIETIQLHPAYTYEDFIQGLRPIANPETGQLSYKMQPGRFLDFCDRARTRSGNSVLIIDEINRANLASVFGELLYLLEYRDQSIKLAGSDRDFNIPENVYIIGTMNTADRSIALVDHALRRRFAFIELRPDYTILRKWHDRENTGFNPNGLIKTLEKINQAIDNKHYEIGISFFLDRDLANNLADVWQLEIYPYLEEFFYSEPEKIKEFQWETVQAEILSESA